VVVVTLEAVGAAMVVAEVEEEEAMMEVAIEAEEGSGVIEGAIVVAFVVVTEEVSVAVIEGVSVAVEEDLRVPKSSGKRT
jgi:hypothetical protein